MLTLLALFTLHASQALAIPCAAHVEGDQVLLADPIAFTPRTADLTSESAGPVQGVACLLEEQPALTVQIEVHTDARGSETYNLRASQERADALRAALLDRGVAADRLTAVGRGESMPVEHEDWAQSQALSRRIELWIDPGARPPAPVIEPLPEPEPIPVAPRPTAPSLCSTLTGPPGGMPELPGARHCHPTGAGWACAFAEPTATLAGRVQACVGGQRDGEELYAPWRAGTLAVLKDTDTPGWSVVSYTPHGR